MILVGTYMSTSYTTIGFHLEQTKIVSFGYKLMGFSFFHVHGTRWKRFDFYVLLQKRQLFFFLSRILLSIYLLFVRFTHTHTHDSRFRQMVHVSVCMAIKCPSFHSCLFVGALFLIEWSNAFARSRWKSVCTRSACTCKKEQKSEKKEIAVYKTVGVESMKCKG